jgi:Spy/CpxP family protein refolding chaperone
LDARKFHKGEYGMKFNSRKYLGGSVAILALLAVALVAGYHISQRVMAAPIPTMEQEMLGGGEHGHFGHHGFNAERMTSFLTDYLNLSDAQQTQVHTILTNAKPHFDQFHSQLMDLHTSVRQAALVQPFDEAKIRTLITQKTAGMVEAGVEMARVESQINALLTPEQQAKLQQHLQHMGKHEMPPAGDTPPPPQQ